MSPVEGCERMFNRKQFGNSGLAWKQSKFKPNLKSMGNC